MRKRIQQLLSTTLIAFGLASRVSQNAPSDNAALIFRTPAQTYSDTSCRIYKRLPAKSWPSRRNTQAEAAGSDEERDRVFREADDKWFRLLRKKG